MSHLASPYTNFFLFFRAKLLLLCLLSAYKALRYIMKLKDTMAGLVCQGLCPSASRRWPHDGDPEEPEAGDPKEPEAGDTSHREAISLGINIPLQLVG